MAKRAAGPEGVPAAGPLRPWAEGVWIAEAPLRFYGLALGARMTLVRLGSGSLLLHSPIAMDAPLVDSIARLGRVAHLVAPNKLHHLHLGAARAHWPEATLWAPPGLAEKRTDLDFDGELGRPGPYPWEDTLETLVVRGSRLLEEVVFFHPASRTLLVGDLCMHLGPWSPPLTRLAARLARMYGRPCMPPDLRLSIRDRAAARAAFGQLLTWDFDRVILAHGLPLESGARVRMRREYAWTLTGS